MGKGDVMFVPQRPYLPLGMLRDIVLYPMWRDASGRDPSSAKPFPGPRWVNTLFWKGGFTGLDDTLRETGKGSERAGKGEGDEGEEGRAAPTDEAVLQALTAVGLEKTLERFGGEGGHAKALEAEADWSAVLSVGEQQRVAFARLLLAKPKVPAGRVLSRESRWSGGNSS